MINVGGGWGEEDRREEELRNASKFTSQELHCHLHGNFGIGVVSTEFKVFKLEVFNVFHLAFDGNSREGTWFSLELLLQRSDVVDIHMSVTEGVHKITRLEKENTCHHCSGSDQNNEQENSTSGVLRHSVINSPAIKCNENLNSVVLLRGC